MAGIILKDGVGNELEYSDVKQIKIPYQDSEGKISAYKFTRIVNLNAYAIIGQGSTNNIANYKVMKKLQYLPSQDFFMCSVTDTDCQELGDENTLIVFLTPKSLTVGETYAATEMY